MPKAAHDAARSSARLVSLCLVLLSAPGCAVLPAFGGRGADETLPGLLENRAWMEEGAAVPGTLRAWLGSGELLMASCWEVPRLARWRWRGTADLEWVDAGTPVRAEVIAVGPEELALLVEADGVPRTLRYQAAEGANPC